MFDLSPSAKMPRQTLLAQSVTALPQTPEFTRALKAVGQAPLVLDRMQDIVVLRRKIWGRLPVAMINRAVFQRPDRLLEILQEEGLRRTPIVLSPETPCLELARLGALPLMTPAHVARLDLRGSETDRRARLHQKWRNRLVRAEALPLRVTRQTLPQEANHWIFQADAAQQKDRGYKSWPVALTLAYGRENAGQAKLFQVFDGKEAIAAMVVLTHGQGATYHISQTTERGKALSAHNLLMWSAMNWLASKNIQMLDLGVINTEEAAGLARFKLGTGAQLHKLGGTWIFWPPLGRRLAPLASLDLRLMRA